MPTGIQQVSDDDSFEIACYKNKVLEWRSGVEKDLDNVLQIPNVFINVSKGQVASSQDLKKAFGDQTLDDIILQILNKGEIQVGEKERSAQLQRIHNEVLDVVASKLVDPKSKRPYTTGIIERALEQLTLQKSPSASQNDLTCEETSNNSVWTGVVANRSAKSQALEAMKLLIKHQPIPISRARLRLRLTLPMSLTKIPVKLPSNSTKLTLSDPPIAKSVNLKEGILSLVDEVISQDCANDEWELIAFIEPGVYKELTQFISDQSRGRAHAEILETAFESI